MLILQPQLNKHNETKHNKTVSIVYLLDIL